MTGRSDATSSAQIPQDGVPAQPQHALETSSITRRLLEITAASSLAIAQPFLWLIVANPTFAVAHGLSGFSLVLFGLAAVALPAILLGSISVAVNAGPSSVSKWFHRLLMGMLIAATLTPILNRLIRIDQWADIILLAVLVGLGTAIYTFSSVVRTIIRYAICAPLLIPILFVLSGSIRPLLQPVPAIDIANITSDTAPPIVWLVFDQLPLALLLDSHGDILEDRFPGFARMRDIGTWYPNAMSVAPDTHTSVASALTGRFPHADSPPIASQHPSNAFTLLGGAYEISSHESVTRLCPDPICDTNIDLDPMSLVRDSSVIVGRLLIPNSLASRILPPMETRWTNFGAPESSSEEPKARGDDRGLFARFLADLGDIEPATFFYFHQEKPHEPLLMLPDGRTYDFCSCFYTEPGGRWPDDEVMMEHRMQRYVMQIMHVDRELDLVLDQLEDSGVLKDTLMVVMSDHGASMIAGRINRGVDPETLHDIFPVPLFVKYPGQQNGRVDPRSARLIDILPTVMDSLDANDSLTEFEGSSLLGAPTTDPPLVLDGNDLVDLGRPTASRSGLIPMHERLLPVADNPFVFGKHGRLVGQDVSDFSIGQSELSATIATAVRFENVALDGIYVPAHVIGEHSAERSVPIAVAFNGRIAGVGSTFFSDVWRISIMGDPSYLRDGDNELALYEITDGQLLSIPFEP